MAECAALLASLGLQVLQRDWLSANHTVARASDHAPATVVDTGHQRHAAMSLALIQHALGGQPLGRIVNTHLHSDHCGGNHALQAQAAESTKAGDAAATLATWVPSGYWAAAQHWDETRLSYRATGQTCPRFAVSAALADGDTLPLGPARWQVLAAPGHDPDALMLFEPQTRTLIAGDALWQDRLAVVFPELAQPTAVGFAATRATLARIEALAPRCVIPGHGPVFADVGAALAASRARLDAFERQPLRHTRYACRALALFHVMEAQALPRAQMLDWLTQTPLMQSMAQQLGATALRPWAEDFLAGLLDEGLLQITPANELCTPAAAQD